MEKYAFLGYLYLSVSLLPFVYGQLNTAEKQALLDLHNELRGAAGGGNIVQTVWDGELANTAQQYSEECHFSPNPSVTTTGGVRRGENLGYTRGTSLLDGAVDTMRGWVQSTGDPSYTQALWWNVTAIGCGSYQCSRLSLAGGGRVDGASYLVCYYLTVYISGMPPFTPGGSCSRCPSGYSTCDGNGLCAVSSSPPVVQDDTTPPPAIVRRVTSRSPRYGSVGGGTRLTLRGQGFSGNQHTGANEVYFKMGNTILPCDVQAYYSTTTQIVCDTRATPDGEEWRGWSLIVRVRDGEEAEWEDVDICRGCNFQHRFFTTPLIERLEPYAGQPSSLVDIFGRIFTVAFDDTPEDPPTDVISRLTVGNRLCDHVNDDGELYGATMTSNVRGTVTCLTNTSNIIDSMNVSLTLDRYGSSSIRQNEYIIGIDNKLRPYSYQTHADILSVVPAGGSIEGGTTITVTASVNLNSYRSDEVEVYVGGQECKEVMLIGNGSIQCITPCRPSPLPYYPGGRGLRREVWLNGPNIWLLDGYLPLPLSPDNSVQERTYRDSSDPREFGERVNFVQRYSGFFVPPITSLYTFQIISDDLSRLYVSPTASAEDMEIAAFADQFTANSWTRFESQTSAPMIMERGQYYYMEAYSNNGRGPWSFGISAKVHSLPYTSYPYNGDRETQRILTSSTLLQEIHALSLTVSPAVYDVDIVYYAAEEEMGECDVTVAIGSDTLTLYPDTMTSDLQNMLNTMETIQGVGGVTVERREGTTEDGYIRILLRLIFLTGAGVTHDHIIPSIDTYSNANNCSMNITAGFTQLLTTPTFQVGFPDSPRQTRPLPAGNTTAEQLQEEMETLLSNQCSKNTPPTVLLDLGYEESEGDGVVRSTAYCGRQSFRSPTITRGSDRYQTNIYTHVCFAYYDTLPALTADVHYYTTPDRVGTDITFDLQDCPDWPMSSDGLSWSHVCINLHTCLSSRDPEGQMFEVESLSFNGLVDEVAIAAGSVEVVVTAVPIAPGGVQISAVTVTGGYESPPLLIETDIPASNLDLNISFGPLPTLVVSSFQVSYTVEDCGSGMPLLEGTYDQSNSSVVDVMRVQAGTPGITGTFDLSFNGREIREIPAGVSASVLDQLLEANFPSEGGFSVTPGGQECWQRWWDVMWDTREADVPSMTADGTNLVGNDPTVVVVTAVDGGMWLRPIRGDMLRLPELSPQVEVIINSIPSSCNSGNCSFSYSAEATPLINYVYPSSGQEGTNITVFGSGFQGDGEGVRVWLGEVECIVTRVNDSEIDCTVRAHPAGGVGVKVHVPGSGYASYNDSTVCFQYLVTLTGVQPLRGSTEGGTSLTITGHGFLPTRMVDSSAIGSSLASEAWLARGFGWPVLPPLSSLCPDLAAELVNLTDYDGLTDKQTLQQLILDDRENETELDLQMMIARFYRDFPIQVFVGSSPCIVTSATLYELNCTTTQHEDGPANVTVSVLGEMASYEDGYSYDEDLTPAVFSVTPTSGPVFGGTVLTIEGRSLEDTTSVVIGDAPCTITARSSDTVTCSTASHAPATLPVVVTTSQGVARTAMEGSGEDQTEDETPMEGSEQEQSVMEGSGDDFSRSTPFLFSYELEVNSFGPLQGSVNGGLLLTIEGRGFHPALTTVLIGDSPATVTAANDTVVQCITPPPAVTHTITFVDGGYSFEDGYQFSWSTVDTVVQTGDTVTWEWNLDIPGLEVNVFQTASAGSSSRLEGGFYSESSAIGSFSSTFTRPGVVYYATELTQQLVVYGTVTVQERGSQNAAVRILVDGYRADYVPENRGGDILMPDGGVSEERRNVEECDDGVTGDDGETEANGLSLVYSVCSTPTLTSVAPQSGTVLTNFTLTGSLLTSQVIGLTPTVLFGGYDCIVLSSNDTEIVCQLDPTEMPPSFSPLLLSVSVPGLGYAVADMDQTAIELSPVITSLSPVNSSTEGGSHLFISGYGFPDSEVTVTVGGGECTVTHQNYTNVQCVTPGGPAGAVPVQASLASAAGDSFECVIDSGCEVVYSVDHTPVVSSTTPSNLIGPDDIVLEISGVFFSSVAIDNHVTVGDAQCQVVVSNSTFLQCTLCALPAGAYPLSLTVCPSSPTTQSYCPGRADVMISPLTSPAEVSGISPQQGSIAGGTHLTIIGLGFSDNRSRDGVSVRLGDQTCTVMSLSYTRIECVTTANTAGSYDVIVTSHGIDFPVTQQYNYSMTMTPVVMSVTPSNGQQGTDVMIAGTNLGGGASTSVEIGGVSCAVDSEQSSDTAVMCTLGLNLAGEHNINVEVVGLGMAVVQDELTFSYDLELTSFSPTSGSLAGMSSIVIGGLGFNPTDLSVSVCEQECSFSTIPGSLSEVECILPSMTSSGGVVNCGITVQSLGLSLQYNENFTFSEDLTPVVTRINRTRGGTQGGSRILIEGSGFDGVEVQVTIAGVVCEIVTRSDSEIVCDTGPSGRTTRAQVMVFVAGKGFARSENIMFWYVDLWSSRFTWGNEDPPQSGQLVVIPRGQTLVLDTVTPVLGYVVVQGGELVFDEEAVDDQVALHTHGMIITEGGKLVVGTEDNPFTARTQIVLYGDVLSTEIPVYGAKTLALRQGSIDIHGKPLSKTWTRLAETASAGSTVLRLEEAVDWEVGGKIVVASTSFSQRENEELTIAEVMEDGTVLRLETALEYDHIAVVQTIDGREIVTRAEVGYLTRNVVVRGSVNEEFVSEVSACPEEFRTGQFQLQTCFLGRFGDETLSDQFGSQIMIHAPEQNQGDVAGRFSYIEVTHAGQAFRLGRYPIHFHLNGDVSGSYVRGCSIHHTFNRAVTIHAVDNLLVENNVAYNILGHAYFLEDGIEQNNVIQDNLGVFVRASSSLLNVDITPATFWMVNPNNIVRRNAAAGGTHFGFWYRLPVNPTGPSFDGTVFPQQLPLGEFSDNSAHSFGWYGLWVFPRYTPTETAEFRSFLSWKNERGVEFADAGALQLHNSTLLDNEEAGFEATALEAKWGGPLVKNVLIVGHSDVTSDDTDFCTTAGVKTPHTPYLTVESVTFVNFDREACTVIAACSHCRNLQGGFESRFRGISFVNSPRLTVWKWMHEHYHRDLDGTLTGTGEHSILVPSANILPPSCTPHPTSSYDLPGSICPGSVDFTRFALFNPTPSATLKTDLILLTNSYGTTAVEYEDKRLLFSDGHMALLPVNESYAINWNIGVTFTNTTYQLLITDLEEDDYIFIQQPYSEPLDYIEVNGKTVNASESFAIDPSRAETGDWFSDDNNTINYIVTGDDDGRVDVSFKTYACFYEDCIPPPPPTLPPPIPPGRPEETQSWSDPTIWPNGELPRQGQDVFINCSWYLLLDVAIPRLATLTVCGALEVMDGMDHVIEADIIIITGGRLVAGYPDTPLTSKVTFLLHGNRSSPEVTFDIGPILGAKAMGVFGELILTSVPRTPTWTTLGATVEQGGTEIVLSERVEWEVGDEIVITSTSYEGIESETATIATVSGSRTRLTLNSPLQYKHVHETETVGSNSYTVTAEVGLLTRDITITNGNSAMSDSETFGCRVLVGYIEDNGGKYLGSVQMNGVELSGCGQLGYTETYDPRFALAIRNINGRDSYITSCSIHDGYNTGIGVFGTNSVLLSNNVIHNTVGSAIQADGSHLVVTSNLASLSHFLATYRKPPTEQRMNSDWTANYELASAINLTLRGNVAAGGNKAGFHVDGDDCTVTGDALQVADNTAHSTLHGLHLGYSDGHPSGCSHIARFTAHSCYHYAIFSYCRAEVRVSGATLVNNNAGIFAAVIGPASLSHQLGDKQVVIEESLIVSATPELDCTRDSIEPVTSLHPQAFSGLRLRSPTDGHVGVIIPVFVSSPGHRTLSGWSSISAYPAISGKTTVRDVTFAGFGNRCSGKMDTLLITHGRSEDCNHPTHLERIVHHRNNDDAMKYFNHEPILSSINPSDCVDLDCDGLKHVLVRDEDGSFLSTDGARSLVSMAQLGWGDNGPRGLGNFRIPTAMLATPGGGMSDVDTLFPNQGIVRGTGVHGNESQCTWNADWNSYVCQGIDHLMIVIESLDDDTEVRRLSPVGLASNGFIDILNGPMDNGWCGGYTCQERISTFFGIVASGLTYTMALTSTNPQNMALHLLNAEDSQAIVIAIIYNNPQRLDVYQDGEYVVPNNAMVQENGNLEYQTGTPADFIPTITQSHGANYYDRDTKRLYILVRGMRPYEIRTTPVIQVGLSLEVSVDDFFNEDRLVENLAFLLGIDATQIRVVNVVMETITKRRRRQDEGVGSMMRVSVDFEIGNPPPTVVTMDTTNTTTSDNETMSDNSTVTQAPPTSPTLSFDQLQDLTETLVDVIQTGQLTSDLNATVVNAIVMEPEPEFEDPTKGTRATPETGGPQPTDNGTDTLETFSDIQREMELEEANETVPIVFTIPSRLVERGSSETGVEGRPLPRQPIIVMFDNLGGIINNLGLEEAWRVRAVVEEGPSSAFLTNDTADLVDGQAQFSGLQFSYPGNYRLSFVVEFPVSANFRVEAAEEVMILPRELTLIITRQPGSWNTSFPLYPYPKVELWEDGEILSEHDWRNSTWFVRATLQRNGQSQGSWEVELNSGYAQFTEIRFSEAGQYTLLFTVFTQPQSLHIPPMVTSQYFDVDRHPLTRLELTFDEDYDEVIGENDEYLSKFKATFVRSFQDTFPSSTVQLYNVTVARGSIIVSLFLTAKLARDLQSYVEMVVTSNGTLSFTFRNIELSPSVIVMDPSYPIDVSDDSEDELTLILVTIIPAGTVLFTTLLIILIVILCYRRRQKSQSFKPSSVVTISNMVAMKGHEGRYVHHGVETLGSEEGDMEEYYLTNETDRRLGATQSTLTFHGYEMKERSSPNSKASVMVSKEVVVSAASVYVNPSLDQEEVGRYVTVPTRGKTAATESIGELGKEVNDILTQSGSLIEAETKLQ